MNINNPGFASLQTSIHSGWEAFAGGSEVKASRAVALNTAISSFQSLQSQIGQLLSEGSQAAKISEAASFADPASFYRTLNASDPVLKELSRPAFQPLHHLKQLSSEIGAAYRHRDMWQVVEQPPPELGGAHPHEDSLPPANEAAEILAGFKSALDQQLKLDPARMMTVRLNA